MARRPWTWLQDARVIMPAAFLAALCFAIGHHVFYQNLQGQNTFETKYSQARNINIGTAFAFLVKICLTIAIATAYSQVLWRTFLNHRLRVSQIDSLSGLVNSPGFEAFGHGLRFPLLLGVAIIAWFISVATIFPPGTLSVYSDTETNQMYIVYPTLDFTQPIVNANASRVIGASGINTNISDPSQWTHEARPRSAASIISTMTALTGVPRFSFAKLNSSYSISFPGPALQCETKQVTTAPVYCDATYLGFGQSMLYYISFLKYPQDSGDSFGEFFDLDAGVPLGTQNNTIACSAISPYRTSTFGNAPPQLNLALLTTYNSDTSIGWNTTTCTLSNATYHVNISFPGNDQILSATTSNSIPVGDFNSYFGPPNPGEILPPATSAQNPIYNYHSLLSLMASLTAGTLNGASDANVMSSETNTSMDITPAGIPTIFSTSLLSSPEFQALNHAAQPESVSTIEESAFQVIGSSAPLAEQLEELFMNITLAMLTNPSTSSGETVLAQVESALNRYEYSAVHLWISYGIGLLLALLVIGLGLTSLAANRASYSTKFSTFLRTMTWGEMDKMGVDRGADPVPDSVAGMKVLLGRNKVPDEVEGQGLMERDEVKAVPMVHLNSAGSRDAVER